VRQRQDRCATLSPERPNNVLLVCVRHGVTQNEKIEVVALGTSFDCLRKATTGDHPVTRALKQQFAGTRQHCVIANVKKAETVAVF